MELVMKTAEDEAFDELARRQGMWGGGFPAKRQMAADKQEPWNEDEWRRNNWRCGHGWLRGEQCEICNAPRREWVGLTDEERESIAQDYSLTGLGYRSPFKAIEAMLKEKNT
jgi:hypothetical protein